MRPSIKSFLNENSQDPDRYRYIVNQNNTLKSIYHTLATTSDFLWYNRRKETFIFMKTTILIQYILEICKKSFKYLAKHQNCPNEIFNKYLTSIFFFVSKELSFTIESLELILFSGNIFTVDNEIERIKEEAKKYLFDELPKFEKIEFPQKRLENKENEFKELLKKRRRTKINSLLLQAVLVIPSNPTPMKTMKKRPVERREGSIAAYEFSVK